MLILPSRCSHSTAIGHSASDGIVQALGAIAIGYQSGSSTTADNSIAIGRNAQAGQANSICIGRDCTVTSANELSFGSVTATGSTAPAAGAANIVLPNAQATLPVRLSSRVCMESGCCQCLIVVNATCNMETESETLLSPLQGCKRSVVMSARVVCNCCSSSWKRKKCCF